MTTLPPINQSLELPASGFYQFADATGRRLDEIDTVLDAGNVRAKQSRLKFRRWVTRRRARVEEVRLELSGDADVVTYEKEEPRQ